MKRIARKASYLFRLKKAKCIKCLLDYLGDCNAGSTLGVLAPPTCEMGFFCIAASFEVLYVALGLLYVPFLTA